MYSTVRTWTLYRNRCRLDETKERCHSRVWFRHNLLLLDTNGEMAIEMPNVLKLVRAQYSNSTICSTISIPDHLASDKLRDYSAQVRSVSQMRISREVAICRIAHTD